MNRKKYKIYEKIPDKCGMSESQPFEVKCCLHGERGNDILNFEVQKGNIVPKPLDFLGKHAGGTVGLCFIF